MKNLLLLKTLLIFSVFWGYNAIAQNNNDAATYFAKLITAQKYLLGDGLPKDSVKALRLYKDCAENGKMPMAMNQLGHMYQTGTGVGKDLKNALYWFLKSTEKGDPIGMFRLGSMYKKGEGVAQDFSKAFNYFKASAEKGYNGGMYGAGYCYYKGLGTSQSYNEAVKWFRKGVDIDCPVCTYMLGDCYRNGYGVEQNEQEAIRLLKKASDKKISLAEKELKIETPEVFGNKHDKNKNGDNGKGNNSPEQKEKFAKLLKHQDNLSLNGTWIGTMYFYDWSGQHILGEDSLMVILKQSGNKLTGQWFQNNELVVRIDGIIVDGQIVFNGNEFNVTNRFGESYPMFFKAARFEALNADVNYLAGNIESYSPYTKEPGVPCYVIMSKVIEKSVQIDKTKTTTPGVQQVENTTVVAEKNSTTVAGPERPSTKGEMTELALDYFKNKIPLMTVYPNPFNNEINITFKTTSSCKVALYVYSLNGTLVLQKNIGDKPAGTFTEKVQPGLTSGQYIIKLVAGDEVYAKLINKQ